MIEMFFGKEVGSDLSAKVSKTNEKHGNKPTIYSCLCKDLSFSSHWWRCLNRFFPIQKGRDKSLMTDVPSLIIQAV